MQWSELPFAAARRGLESYHLKRGNKRITFWLSDAALLPLLKGSTAQKSDSTAEFSGDLASIFAKSSDSRALQSTTFIN